MLRTVLLAVAGANLRLKVVQLRRAAIFGAAAAICGLLGLIFLLLAAYVFTAQRYGAAEAAAGFGAGFIVLALLIYIIGRLRAKAGITRSEREERTELMKSVATGAAIGAAPTLMRSLGIIGSIALPLVGVAGYVLYREFGRSRSPRRNRPS